MMKNVLKWLAQRSSRATVYSWAAVAAFLVASRGSVSTIWLVVPVAAIQFILALGVYTFNDLTDLEVDLVNGKERTQLIDKIGRRTSTAVVASLFGAGLFFGYVMGTAILLVVLLQIAVGVAYSAPVIALKDKFVVKTLAVGFGAALTSVLGGAVAGSFTPVLLPAVVFFVFIFASSPINDLVDIKGDRANGRRTIPIVIGAKQTVTLSILMTLSTATLTFLLFADLGYTVVAPLAISAVVATALYFLYPLLRGYDDGAKVKWSHKKLVVLHLFFQAGFVMGVL